MSGIKVVRIYAFSMDLNLVAKKRLFFFDFSSLFYYSCRICIFKAFQT